MVQQADLTGQAGHHPAAVYEKNNPLALIRLKVFYGQLSSTRRGPPINMLEVVVLSVVSQPFKLIVLADLPRSRSPSGSVDWFWQASQIQ